MRAPGLAGVRRGKAARTTVPAKDGTRAGDLLDRNFTAPAPDRVWVSDFHAGPYNTVSDVEYASRPAGSTGGTTDACTAPLE